MDSSIGAYQLGIQNYSLSSSSIEYLIPGLSLIPQLVILSEGSAERRICCLGQFSEQTLRLGSG